MPKVSNEDLNNAAEGMEVSEEVVEEVIKDTPIEDNQEVETNETETVLVEDDKIEEDKPEVSAPIETDKKESNDELTPEESTRLGRKLAAQAKAQTEALEKALKRIEELESKPVVPQEDEYDDYDDTEEENGDRVLTVSGFKALQEAEAKNQKEKEKTYQDNYVSFIDNKDIELENLGNEEALVLHDLVVTRMSTKGFGGSYKGEGQSDAERNYNLAQTQILNEQITELRTQNANPERQIPVIGKKSEIPTGVSGDSSVVSPKAAPVLEIKDEDTKNFAEYLTSQGVTPEEMSNTLSGDTPMQLKKTIG